MSGTHLSPDLSHPEPGTGAGAAGWHALGGAQGSGGQVRSAARWLGNAAPREQARHREGVRGAVRTWYSGSRSSRELRPTTRSLESLATGRYPVEVTTIHPLVPRELALLRDLAQDRAARAVVPLRSLVARPRESSPPATRLHTIYTLAEAGIPVGIALSVATEARDRKRFAAELPALLAAAQGAGAQWATLAAAGGDDLLRQPFQFACARLGLETVPVPLSGAAHRQLVADERNRQLRLL